ncbi:hypothetical protein [Corynebacterium liangguodongii]|uniref:Uncharacterized protein n=1 Tax=Corynebacterium liangguodongii TaxID=2079535 RepID=A0A2S0WG17_9CORY|nr:hypothetical protein [Corynebacterium liangguodongii]AWB84709.1 hypothetical protein C3E79_09680 [Corynebacterium liangguodongii]PWB99717.1 hypothetical protein DF219_05460 [Corynebacterium liangguodongii]
MRLIHCQCGGGNTFPGGHRTLSLPPVPGRTDFGELDRAAAELLPVDTTPTLAQIQARPDVAHMSEPQLAPQRPSERLRVLVSGGDAALSAVLTRMMRRDYMWVEIAYLPTDPASPAAIAWGNPAFEEACDLPVVPSPLIRTDFGEAVAGSATVTSSDPAAEFVGEIIVDSEVLALNHSASARFFGTFGARLVPTASAPGLAAVRIVTPARQDGRPTRLSPPALEWLRRLPGGGLATRPLSVPPAQTDPSRVLAGRALQAGGRAMNVTVDGRVRRRGVEKVTFYRHLRDIQSVKIAP